MEPCTARTFARRSRTWVVSCSVSCSTATRTRIPPATSTSRWRVRQRRSESRSRGSARPASSASPTITTARDASGARSSRATRRRSTRDQALPAVVLGEVTPLHRVAASELEALRDRGWPALTAQERADAVTHVLRNDPSKGSLRLSFIERAADTEDVRLLRTPAGYLLMIEHQVPAVLRGRYDAWVAKLFGPHARTFGVAPNDADMELREASSLAMLAIHARDRGMLADATALMPKLAELDGVTRILVQQAAVADNPRSPMTSSPSSRTRRRRDEPRSGSCSRPCLIHSRSCSGIPRRSSCSTRIRRWSSARICDETRRADVDRLGRPDLRQMERLHAARLRVVHPRTKAPWSPSYAPSLATNPRRLAGRKPPQSDPRRMRGVACSAFCGHLRCTSRCMCQRDPHFRLVVALDLSEYAEIVLEYALDQAARHSAPDIHFVHVIEGHRDATSKLPRTASASSPAMPRHHPRQSRLASSASHSRRQAARRNRRARRRDRCALDRLRAIRRTSAGASSVRSRTASSKLHRARCSRSTSRPTGRNPAAVSCLRCRTCRVRRRALVLRCALGAGSRLDREHLRIAVDHLDWRHDALVR